MIDNPCKLFAIIKDYISGHSLVLRTKERALRGFCFPCYCLFVVVGEG